ncbi:hypothetical protein GALL_129110 [mine drainage metagenome]|uniref:Uncharacterized protein n=1 Tax=mine drainage metagenome TaxID=410659 RepID=A0A1J5S9T6_9ZZZZ
MHDLFEYIGKLELIAFFSAFPLVYYIVFYIASDIPWIHSPHIKKLPVYLPRAYALTVTLYCAMKINEYLPVHISTFSFDLTSPYFYLKGWAFAGLLFWLPGIRTKSKWALVHSIPFILLIVYDFFNYYHHTIETEVLHNEMRLYFVSVLINLVTLLMVALYFGIRRKR